VKLGAALDRLHASTSGLAHELRTLAERHATEHDVYHVGMMLATRCDAIAASLSPFLRAYGQKADGEGDGVLAPVAERVRRSAAALGGRSSKTGLLLLRDLRELYTDARGTEMDWTIVRQASLAARDEELVNAATVGLEETRRVGQWLSTRIKETAPQVLVSAE
jgi:hypothetical protein